MTGFDAGTGAERWRQWVGQWHVRAAGAECFRSWEPVIGSGRYLLATTVDQRAQVIDLATGAVRFTGPPASVPVTMVGEVVLVRTERGHGDLVATDIATGVEQWLLRVPGPDGRGEYPLDFEHAAVGERLVLPVRSSYLDGTLMVIDVRAGKVTWTARGPLELIGASPDGMVTANGDESEPAEVRYYPF